MSEWREAAVRLPELPSGQAHVGAEKEQPGEPLISSPGRLEWLPYVDESRTAVIEMQAAA